MSASSKEQYKYWSTLYVTTYLQSLSTVTVAKKKKKTFNSTPDADSSLVYLYPRSTPQKKK